LENGWNPFAESQSVSTIILENSKSTEEVLYDLLKEKLKNPYSIRYKRELEIIHNQFISFLNVDQKKAKITDLSINTVETFLDKFKSTGTYYMFKRRTLGVFFSALKRKKILTDNLVLMTPRMKSKATLHAIYSKEQVVSLLAYLKEKHPNLHLCCLLAYGCLLRPHQEIRLLRKEQFNTELTQITLSGSENKSANIRTVYIPSYVKDELKNRLSKLTCGDYNVISLAQVPFNEFYFSTQWNRMKKNLIEKGLIKPNQTIYSFRHSAAVDIYIRTKDLYLLKELLGHSDMLVTLKYLRGLGVMINETYKGIHAEL